ncbi:ABC-type glycerol-3-phosphate transport system substrate-binding protein [Aequitasia blattaphilus]|uniref:Sugar ABC transporter substrate-binding protein n=1 Tax=Aequitasia blattaphilus TaxID=2949332 RepID=A0ABT1ECJ3_9FIRM|nr:sugar ABC transporter substrate-binding protein [Aequitasia blattaphilus]MCP1103518.1 sugar ABC transporter substrate-binding protein [Aequitasia blattaphilus]MCR8616158.1 sugar ABC transporter substrate-binding protein [Aequitasia blattaphilus]
MRKQSAVIVLLVLMMCIVGCRKDTVKELDDKEKEELVLWSYYETDNQKLALDELIEGFNQSQDTYHMSWEYQGPVTAFTKRLSIGVTQGQLPDVVIMDNPDMRKFVELGTFADITEHMDKVQNLELYYENVLSSVVYDGKYYGLPFCCNNTGLIYNKEQLEENGLKVPTNWDELMEVGKALSNGEGTGYAMSAVEGEQSAFQILSFILSAGGSVETLGDEATWETYEYIDRLIDEGVMSRECINWSQNDLAKAFVEGKCVMMQNGPWVLPLLNESEVSYGIAPLPIKEKYVGVTGGENLGVIKGKNVEGAVAFLNYYSGDEEMLNTALRANSMPPRKDLAEEMARIRPEYEIFVEQMDDCISRSAYGEWPKVTGTLSNTLYQVIAQEASPQEAIENFR